MAFTAADLDTLRTAILALAGGAEEVQIGGRRYKKSALSDLRETYDWLQNKVSIAATSGIQRATFGSVTNQDGDR